VVKLTGAQYAIHPESAPLLAVPQPQMFGLDIPMRPVKPDIEVREGQVITAGELQLRVLECPGHCPGSVALFEPQERVVFTGDVLFAGSIGRTDLWGGDHETLLASIRQKLLPLGDDVRVFAGHGPVTTIGRERRENPFLQG
jgi:glyoxylase-like metal-dependent hydrolase (beta-lactamase superfamily II)